MVSRYGSPCQSILWKYSGPKDYMCGFMTENRTREHKGRNQNKKIIMTSPCCKETFKYGHKPPGVRAEIPAHRREP